MISPAKMLERIKARLAKDRRSNLRLREALAVSRRHTARLQDRLKALKGRNAELEREERKRAREARKAQMRLPL